MNNPTQETELRRQYKSEADEILFDNITFDNRLKERVFTRIQKERTQLTVKERLNRSRRKWLYGATAAAMAIVIITAAPSLLDQRSDRSGGNADENPSIMQPPIEEPPSTLMVDENQSPDVESWQLKTFEEAKVRFGHEMLVPAFIPDDFTLHRIDASGTEETTSKVVFTYATDERTYVIIEDKHDSPAVFADYESVNINGAEGKIKSDDAALNTELWWSAEGIQFMVTGQLTKAEALEVARSLKQTQ